MAKFVDILNSTPIDETDRKAIAELAQKYPVLDEHFASAADLKKMAAENQKISGKVDEWEQWRDANWDTQSQMTKGQAATLRELEAEKARVLELEAKQPVGEEMTFDQIDAKLKESGYARKEDLKGYVDEAGLNKRIAVNNGNFEHIYAKVTPLVFRYGKEFQAEMPMEEFLAYIMKSEDSMRDPAKAYEDWVKPVRVDMANKARQESLDKKETDLKAQEESLRERTSSRTVTDTSEGATGHYQKSLSAPVKKPEEGAEPPRKLGDLTAAQAGLEAYQRGDLSKVVQ